LFQRASAYSGLGDDDRALTDASRAIEVLPNVNHLWYLRARIYTQKHDYERAIADYTEGLRLSPEPQKSSAHRYRAGLESAFSKIEPAIADYSEAIRLRGNKVEPADAALYAARGNLSLAHGETDRAIADFDEAIRLDPKPPGVYYNRGLARARRGEWDRAIAEFEEGKRRAGADKFWLGACLQGRADCLALAGRIEEARGAYQACLKFDAVRTHPVLATSAWFIDRPRGDYEAALHKLDETAKGGMIIQFLKRGLIYVRLGQPDRALADFDEVMTRVKPRPDWFATPDYLVRWLALSLGRGEAYLLKGDLDRALAEADEAVRFAPMSAEARLLRAEVHARRGKADLAAADRREAAKLVPDPMLARPHPESRTSNGSKGH
jgi:tetratricopeptide (TPR) repeat protein